MNLHDHHKQYLLRLSMLSIVYALVWVILRFFPWNDQIDQFLSLSLLIALTSNVAALLYFLLNLPKKNPIQFERVEPMGLFSRNAYLLSTLFFFSGFMTMSSSAGRVSYFFFLIGLVTLPVAHVCYGIWIKKIEKLTN